MTVATGNFAELLWPGIKTIFGNSYNDFEPLYTQVFAQETSDKGFEKLQGVTGLGLAGTKDQGDEVSYDNPLQGFQKEFVHVTYGLGSSVTLEMWEDDQYRYINKIPKMLARSMRHTEEVIHWDVFNNAFSTELTADGSSIINPSHSLVGGGTFRNQLATTSDLTQTSLEQAHIDIETQFVDDQGLRIKAMAKKLVVPSALRYTAMKILETTGEVGSADNTINPMKGIMSLVVTPYLTDSDAWFIMTDQSEGPTTLWRRKSMIDRQNEFDTQNLKFITTSRWSQGVTDPRSMFASGGA